MCEAQCRQLLVQTHALEAMAVDTRGGGLHVQWDHVASATPSAELTFFAEFFATTGVCESWVSSCPSSDSSPNAYGKSNVLGLLKTVNAGGSAKRIDVEHDCSDALLSCPV